MNRRNFFQFGWEKIVRKISKSPLREIVARRLQGISNLLAPEGLDFYIEKSNTIHQYNDERKDIRPSTDHLLLRPPGSLPLPTDFEKACTSCGDCKNACPYNTIQTIDVSGPFIDPNEIACHLCENFPCVEACDEGALLPLALNSLPSFGLAYLHEDRCRNIKDKKSCDKCAKSCPVPNALVSDSENIPHFTEYCTGCGICRSVCPEIPIAIEIIERD